MTKTDKTVEAVERLKERIDYARMLHREHDLFSIADLETLLSELTRLQEEVKGHRSVTRELRTRLLGFVGAMAEYTDCGPDVEVIKRADALLDQAATLQGQQS
jgi:hypothetical protein